MIINTSIISELFFIVNDAVLDVLQLSVLRWWCYYEVGLATVASLSLQIFSAIDGAFVSSVDPGHAISLQLSGSSGSWDG